MQVRNYSDFTTRVAGLIGIPYDSMTSAEQLFIQGYFNTAMRTMWNSNSWRDICPFGEARFAGNLGFYPNDLTQTSYWTATGVTNATGTTAPFNNPADGRPTATKVTETSANSNHGDAQAYTYLYATNYQVSAYFRPNGRNFIYLYANDGVNTYYSFFNLQTGVIGTNSGNLLCSANISQQNNGFWLCTIAFKSATNAGTGVYGFKLSTDGATISYVGNTSLGCYSWGNILLQTSFASPTAFIIPWEQIGEEVIDAVFQVWKDSPVAAGNPRQQGYDIVPDGIQIVGPVGYSQGVIYANVPAWYTLSQFPVYIYYRKQVPNYQADALNLLSAYDTGDQVLFTDSENITNFWSAVSTTTPGQTPDTNPSLWSLIEIPDVFFNYAVYSAYSDWLLQDGQSDKASGMMAKAQDFMDQESDIQERQVGWLPPLKVQTWVTSQPRF